MAGYKKRTAIQYYKDLLTGDALKRTENKFSPDKRQKLSEWHQDHYIKRKDSLKTGSQFAPKGDSAKKYIKGGFDAMIDTARQQNSAKAKIKKVKNLQNVARVGTGAAGALALGAGAYGINKLKNSKKEEIEKKAGVEYGWTSYQDPTGKLTDQLSEIDKSDDWSAYDKAEELRDKMNSGTAYSNGYNYSEKGIARIPFEYGHEGLENFMYGANAKGFSNYKELTDPYSGERGISSFMAGRDSAEYFNNQLTDLFNKMPDEKAKLKQDFDLAQTNVGEVTSKVNRLKSEADKLNAKKTNILTSLLNPKLKVQKMVANNNLRKATNNLSEAKFKAYMAKRSLNTPTDRDLIEQYKASLENSLKDENNNMYSWGFY